MSGLVKSGGFQQAGVGAVWRSARDKMRERKTFRDFGAKGDFITDDTAAIRKAFESDRCELDGEGLTYRISDNLVNTKGHSIRKMKIGGSLAAGGTSLTFNGTEGVAQYLMGSITAGSVSFQVPDPSKFVKDGWIWMGSDKDFSGTAKAGEMVRCKSIVGSNINLYDGTYLPYSTAVGSLSRATPLNLLEGVELDGVDIIGELANTGQTGIIFYLCSKPTVRGTKTSDCHYVSMNFKRCFDGMVVGGTCERTGVENNLNYDVVVSMGCYRFSMYGRVTMDARHGLAVGGGDGVSRFVDGSHNHGYGCLDAHMDAHPSVGEVIFSYNTIDMSADAGTADGIICQSGDLKAHGNIINGVKRHGVFYQGTAYMGRQSCSIRDNTGRTTRAGASTNFILVTTESTNVPNLDAVDVSNNDGGGWPNFVQIYAKATNIKRAKVAGNTSLDPITGRGIYLRADAGLEIGSADVSRNRLELDPASVVEAMYFSGVGTGRIKNATVTANHTTNGTLSLRIDGTVNVTTDGTNTFETPTTNVLSVANSTGYNIRETGQLLITNMRQQVTIAGDAVAIVAPMIQALRLDTEAAAASDNLQTISGGYVGQELRLCTTASGRVVVCKDSIGNLRLAGGDVTLNSNEDMLTLRYDGTSWYQTAFADNA